LYAAWPPEKLKTEAYATLFSLLTCKATSHKTSSTSRKRGFGVSGSMLSTSSLEAQSRNGVFAAAGKPRPAPIPWPGQRDPSEKR